MLENIRVFVRVVELGSLSAAGRHLRISPAVVSHRMQQLENHVGVRLLNRTTRQVRTTEQGAVFYEHCLEVLRALEDAESSVASVGATPHGNLRVTAPLGFGRRILAPLVPVFHERYPNIDIRLRLSDHLLDLLGEAVDVAVRMAVLRDSSFVVRKIRDCPRVLCASPRYLAAHRAPERPEDLMGHHCLLLRFPGSEQFQWTLRGPEGPVKLAVSGRFDSDDADVLGAWALDGHGIVMKPLWEVAGHLESGALEVVLPDYSPEPVTLAVLYPHRHLLPAKVRAFTDFIVTEARALLSRPERSEPASSAR